MHKMCSFFSVSLLLSELSPKDIFRMLLSNLAFVCVCVYVCVSFCVWLMLLLLLLDAVVFGVCVCECAMIHTDDDDSPSIVANPL